MPLNSDILSSIDGGKMSKDILGEDYNYHTN